MKVQFPLIHLDCIFNFFSVSCKGRLCFGSLPVSRKYQLFLANTLSYKMLFFFKYIAAGGGDPLIRAIHVSYLLEVFSKSTTLFVEFDLLFVILLSSLPTESFRKFGRSSKMIELSSFPEQERSTTSYSQNYHTKSVALFLIAS